MSTAELFSPEAISLELEAGNQAEAINQLIDMLESAGALRDRAGFHRAILEREAVSTTAIEYGIAIPHGKSSAVQKPMVAYGYSRGGIQYNPEGNEKSHLFFMIAAPENSDNLHLKTLASLSRKLIHQEFREALAAAATKEEALAVLQTV